MKLSVIIPTHNRASILEQTLLSVIYVNHSMKAEIIVVDNNSVDQTKNIAGNFKNKITYVFEERVSFTRARQAGREQAGGDVLLFIDDDILMMEGTMEAIIDVLKNGNNCGVVGGMIRPKFSIEPPSWVLKCQKSFNGLSLFNPEQIPWLKKHLQKVPWVPGPLFGITTKVYDECGGFPPDTVGVETNYGSKKFNKWYIGPGDYGLCYKAKKAGYKIFYTDKAEIKHVIPKVRMTTEFWKSRVIGEGFHEAITQRGFYHLGRISALIKRVQFIKKLNDQKERINKEMKKETNKEVFTTGILPIELWLLYYKSYLDMDKVLEKYPDLWRKLWKIGLMGVGDDQYDDVVGRLPKEYLYLVSDEYRKGL